MAKTTESRPFLPPDYEVPKKAGKYMRFQKGENRIRILAPPLLGYVAWKTQDGKTSPLRRTLNEFHPDEFDKKTGTPKHFWAMPVWDYTTERVKVLEMTQSTIQSVIKDLAGNKKWGTPTSYDIVITAIGDGMEREYSVIPDPKEPLCPAGQLAWEDLQDSFDINRLLANGDPFGDEPDVSVAGEGDEDIPF